MFQKSTISLTEAEVQNCTWTMIEMTPEYRRYVGTGTHPVTGVPIEVLKTEYTADAELQDMNRAQRNINDARRWSQGAGSEKGGNLPLIHVARTPLNKFFAELAPRIEDKDHMKWWLNKPENEPFRTRRGRV